MRHLVGLSLLLFLSFPSAALVRTAEDFLTENELDIIRDSQELNVRISAYFKLAEKRLVILGVADKSAKEKEAERKQQEQYEKDKKKAGDKADKVKPPVDEYDYLRDFTRAELLRGYIQIVEEVMSNLDDAYSRKLDVRDYLEDLEKFTSETLPLLEKFEPKNEAETLAKGSAVQKANEARDAAKEALTVVPKTEKKRKP